MGSGDHFDAAIGRQMSGVQAVPLTPRVNTTTPAFETSEMARKRWAAPQPLQTSCYHSVVCKAPPVTLFDLCFVTIAGWRGG